VQRAVFAGVLHRLIQSAVLGVTAPAVVPENPMSENAWLALIGVVLGDAVGEQGDVASEGKGAHGRGAEARIGGARNS